MEIKIKLVKARGTFFFSSVVFINLAHGAVTDAAAVVVVVVVIVFPTGEKAENIKKDKPKFITLHDIC